jgi:hypothetical protein
MLAPPALLLAVAALAQVPEVLDIENRPPAARLEEPTQSFSLELAMDPVAGQSLQAGEFTLEFAPAPATPDRFLEDGFESP